MNNLTPLPSDLGRRWIEANPHLGDGPVSVESVVSRDWYQWERDAIFKRCWLNVGTTDEIPEPGDFIVRDIHCVNASVVIVRGEDGGIRAFKNVCLHRGNKLIWEFKGHNPSQKISCKFHGFAYDSSGTLSFVPQSQNFYEQLEGKLQLPRVFCDTFKGFIFINLAEEPEETLQSFIGPLQPHLSDYPYESKPHRYHYQSFQRSNWKLGLDAQSEVYHVRYLHGKTWPKLFNNPERPFVESFDIKLYDKHRYGNWPGNPAYQPKDIETFALGKYSSITRLGPTTPTGPGINSSNADDWGFDIVHIFPNTNLLVLPGVWHSHQFWPISENQMLWEIKMHMPEPKTPGERFSDEYARILLRDALREDGTTHENTQEALEMGDLKEIYLQDEEIFIRHHYWAVEQTIKAWRDKCGS